MINQKKVAEERQRDKNITGWGQYRTAKKAGQEEEAGGGDEEAEEERRTAREAHSI